MSKSFIEQSKTEWQSSLGGNPTKYDLQTGSLQRIALATEQMAKNYVQLQLDHDMYKRWYQEEKQKCKELYKSISSLKGHIKRLKNKSK